MARIYAGQKGRKKRDAKFVAKNYDSPSSLIAPAGSYTPFGLSGSSVWGSTGEPRRHDEVSSALARIGLTQTGMAGGGPSIGDIVYPGGPGTQGYMFNGTGWEATGGGGGGGGGYEDDGGGGGYSEPVPPPKATFSEYEGGVAGAPPWWKALMPSSVDPNSEYQTFANLMIPFLSPEDQRTVATNLYQSDTTQFGHFNPELLGLVDVPQNVNAASLPQFYTGERAQDALSAFDRLLEVSGKTAADFGPGYNYLRGLADTLKDFKLTSGASQLSEVQQQQMLAALDPQLAQSGQYGDRSLQSFGALARSFTTPFFSSGSLSGKERNKFGDWAVPKNPRYF